MGLSESVLRLGRGRALWTGGRGLEPLSLFQLLGGVYRGGAGLAGQGEAQGEPIGCRGDGEGVRTQEWHVARPLVVGLEGDEATQLVLGTQFRACAGVYTQGGRMRSL